MKAFDPIFNYVGDLVDGILTYFKDELRVAKLTKQRANFAAKIVFGRKHRYLSRWFKFDLNHPRLDDLRGEHREFADKLISLKSAELDINGRIELTGDGRKQYHEIRKMLLLT